MHENLYFVSLSETQVSRDKKVKGKLSADNTEALILEAMRSGLHFQSLICETILKEIKALDSECDHKVIDILLLLIIFANGGPLHKSAEKVIHKKSRGGFFGENLLRQCIEGRRESLQLYFQDLFFQLVCHF
jgi:Fanconi anemia group D2 protein